MFKFNLLSIKGRICVYLVILAAPFHYPWLLAGPVQGWPAWPDPPGPGSSKFKPNGNCFFISCSSENLTEEWSVLWKYFVCEKKSIELWLWVIIPNKDQYCMARVWMNTPQYKDTWILSMSSALWYLKYFCHASQHSEMMKCLKILCVFFWVTTWHIWELCYITKPQRIIMSIGFVVNQFYQRWLFVSLKSLCQSLEDWKQRRLADDCVQKISFWSQIVVTRQWRKPIKEELTTYLNFPDHTGWEARRRMRRDRDRQEEEWGVILTQRRRRPGTRVTWGHQHRGGTAATSTTTIWNRY